MQRWRYLELQIRNATVEDGKLLPLATPVIIATNGDEMKPMPLVPGLDVLGEDGWEIKSASREKDGFHPGSYLSANRPPTCGVRVYQSEGGHEG